MSDKIYVTVIDGATNNTTTVAAGTNPGEWSLAHHLFFVGVLSSRSPNYAARSQTICNYGFSIDLALYNIPPENSRLRFACTAASLRFGLACIVRYEQALQPVTDQYFRGYDNQFPDFYRVDEWAREFDQFETNGNLPNLELVRVMHDSVVLEPPSMA